MVPINLKLLIVSNNMKLNIPFYRQTSDTNCGPTALKMALDYFGSIHDIDMLEEKSEIKKGKGVFTLQLANTAAKLGFQTKMISKHMEIDISHAHMDFYKKYAADVNADNSKRLIQDAIASGVTLEEKVISLQELLAMVNEKCAIIVLLDWNIISPKQGRTYVGHFVPIVGYDEKYVYVHNQGWENTKEYVPIERDVFDRARKSQGTDEDIIIISK